MNEYISREAVLQKFLERGSGYIDMLTIKTMVGEIPVADVQDIDRWISVEDRLPEIDERVLVYIPKPDNHYDIEIAYISKGNDDYPYWVLRDKSQFYSTRFRYVLRWQPLPERPKEGDTND